MRTERQSAAWSNVSAICRIAVVLLCSLHTGISLAQSIITVAGGGPLGDGKPATEAVLVVPVGVAFDRSGNLYVSDSGHGLVRRIEPDRGVITTIAGGGTSGSVEGGPATLAQLYGLSTVAVDSKGNVYFRHLQDGSRVARVDSGTGIIETFAGGGSGLGDGIPATEAMIDRSQAIAIDSNDNVYVTDVNRVRRIDRLTGLITTVAGTGEAGYSGDGGQAINANLSGPDGLAFDRGGNLYISDGGPDSGGGAGYGGTSLIRRVDADTGVITTIAGNGSECCTADPGDGLPATEAAVWGASGMIFDAEGNLYFTHCCSRIRRIDAKTSIVTTIAGSGGPGFGGDGGPAVDAKIEFPSDLAFDPLGRIVVADQGSDRIRRIDLGTGIITTMAGGGSNGDGGPATSAQLFAPGGVAVDGRGGWYVADTGGERIRHVESANGRIETIAGTGEPEHSGDGGPATQAPLITPYAVDLDAGGNVYVGERFGWVRRVEMSTGTITTIGGNGSEIFSGDGGPATEAGIGNAVGIAIDREGNVFVSAQSGGIPGEPQEYRVRRIDTVSGRITTVAGLGELGFSGDGGPATLARLDRGQGIALDPVGNLFIADTWNSRVRRVDADTGIVTTVAGGGSLGLSDGAVATDVDISYPTDVNVGPDGDLYIVGTFSGVLRVDLDSGLMTIVAGLNIQGFVGDGGPARDASFQMPLGVEVDEDGNIFVADTKNNRIRAIYACREVDEAALLSPVDGAIDVSTAPTLTWSPAGGAFRYDVLLGKEGDVGKTVATDITTTSFTPQNLELGKTYYWRVRAKGDPFCEPTHESLSAIRGFITIPPCEAPPAVALVGPPDGAVVEDFTTTLAWGTVPRVASYDVYLGTTLPPPLLFRGTKQTTFTTPRLLTGNTYYWSIVAHASCDTALTTQSAIRSFFLAGPCNAAGAFALETPGEGAFNVPTTTTISWTASENATSYDLYLGTTNPPSIFLPAMRETSVRIAGLEPNRTYYWRVKATIACDDAKSLTSAVQSFTTEDTCEKPGGTTIVFTPPGAVGVGQTYAIAWRDAPGLDMGGTYEVERSLRADFATILDVQETTTTTATFVADSVGTHYHRVRPITRCNRALTGPDSAAATVSVVEGAPNIIFTVEPEAVISRTGRKLEDLRARFTIENISGNAVSVILGRAEIESVPFFRVVDPLGGDAVFMTLEPRTPKTLELHFAGPPNDVRGAYQGLVVANAAGSPIIPYAFVNLKVGDQAGAIPEFRVSGTASEYAYFPGLDGGDAERAPIEVEIRNPGSAPMELGAEVGPEVWLEPEPGWNETAIPAGGVRTVKLRTKRNRALNGSALPRYTYFGVRTRDGDAARLLVQDNAAPPVGAARTAALEPGVRTFIVPEVVSETATSGTTLVSRVRLTNLGGEAQQAELVYTPTGVDGFDASVRRATVVVPPNDVATLTDPLVQVFAAARPARGQIEVQVAGGEVGFLRVETTVVASDRADASYVRIPTARRGDGARTGLPYEIAGIAAGAGMTTALVLAETSGTGEAKVELTLYDATGASLGATTRTVPRYGHVRVDNVVTTLGGGATLTAGRLVITVAEGGGAVAALAKITDASGERTAVLPATAVTGSVDAKLARRVIPLRGPRQGATASLVAPYVLSGPIDVTGGPSIATLMGFSAPFGVPVEFFVVFKDLAGASLQRTVNVAGGRVVEYKDVLKELFELTGRQAGSILIEADPRGRVYARMVADGAPAGALALATPVSELVTKVAAARPLAIDGLEQSTDPERGSRWNVYLREIAGEAGTLTVRVYEAGNRTHAIAEKHFTIGADGQLALETIFDAMELNTESRRKNRTNVLCVITPRSGNALFTATAVEVDNRTGIPTSHPLQPASGVSSTGEIPSLVQVVSTGNPRVRPVRRP